ncbi:hypothetical protein LCGC14_1434840 [marine sediment metagenome]|uniref:Uncharacterized protein n=1 Tax=marine sediment metagenome TaxID=412755 RepID=A0A0F9JMZ4_9ZZZZ
MLRGKYVTCENCRRQVKRSKLRRHQTQRCSALKRLKERGWENIGWDVPDLLKRAKAPHKIYVSHYAGHAGASVWAPPWVIKIARPWDKPAFLRIALIVASNKDPDMRRAIFAALVADDWGTAVDLIPEGQRWWEGGHRAPPSVTDEDLAEAENHAAGLATSYAYWTRDDSGRVQFRSTPCVRPIGTNTNGGE